MKLLSDITSKNVFFFRLFGKLFIQVFLCLKQMLLILHQQFYVTKLQHERFTLRYIRISYRVLMNYGVKNLKFFFHYNKIKKKIMVSFSLRLHLRVLFFIVANFNLFLTSIFIYNL